MVKGNVMRKFICLSLLSCVSIVFPYKVIAADIFIGKDRNNAEWYVSDKVRNDVSGKLAWVTILNAPESSGVQACSTCDGGKAYFPPKSYIRYMFDCYGNLAQVANIKLNADGSVYSSDNTVYRFSSIAPNSMAELIESKVCGNFK